MLVVFYDIATSNIRMSKIDLFFLWVSVFSFVYINPFNIFDYEFSKRVGLISSFLVFYTFKKYFYLVQGKWFLRAFYFNFIGVLLHLSFTSSFASFAGVFTRVIKINYLDGYRGVSGFAPEPGFMGATSIVFILVAFLMLKSNKVTKKNFYLVVTLSVFMAMASSSGTASLMLLTLTLLVFIFSRYKLYYKIIFLLFIFSMSFIFSDFDLFGRGGEVLIKMLTDPYSLFVLDESVARRAVSISVGIESIAQGNIFGNGIGTLLYVGESIVSNTYLGTHYSEVLKYAGGTLSSFSQYTVEIGIIFLVLMVWIYKRVIPERIFYISRFMTVFFLLASFSILFPPLWLILSLTDKKNIANYNKDIEL
jgi:hypothetical protein